MGYAQIDRQMSEQLQKKIAALAKLGEQLRNDSQLENIIQRATMKNPWFTYDFCVYAINAISEKMLATEKLEQWLANYNVTDNIASKTVGIVMAGNLPLVGFHDFLCAYISGCNIKIKLSAKDDVLFPYVLQKLAEIDAELNTKCAIIDRLEGFDAVIATGSNNTNRYFEYYFRKHPKILRGSRNAVAVLSGHETDVELNGLADDIFMYFGFGCRNLSKIYVPEGFDVRELFPHFDKYKWMHNHSKYMNNYDYNRTLLLMNSTPHLANEIIMLQQAHSISSPVSVLHYEHYKNVKYLEEELDSIANSIQCIVSSLSIVCKNSSINIVKFGDTQVPELTQYADNVDTLEFLLSLKSLN